MQFIIGALLVMCVIAFIIGVVCLPFGLTLTGIGFLFASLLLGKAAKEVIEDGV